MAPSLLDYLSASLASALPGSFPRVQLHVLRSDPQRSHALFPHATTAKHVKVYHEDILVLLSLPAEEGGAPVPVVGIEAALYTVPATATALLYISKVDTTALVPTPASPTRPLVAAFLAYFLQHPPHNASRVRIHIFARAQSQYLFPGSAENERKRTLDDKALLRWWKRTIEVAVTRAESPPADSVSVPAPQLFYLIPGLSYLESLPYVPARPPPLPPTSAEPRDGSTPNAAAAAISTTPPPVWTYGHSYSALSSPLHPASDAPSAHPLVDHIPAFPDDPKSRFLHSLTSSAVSASGTEGDYDDVYLALASASFSTGSTPAQKLAETDRAVERERRRLIDGVPGGVDEWWERMAFRQECCAGQLVGFFVVATGEPPQHAADPHPSAVPAATASAPTSTSTAALSGNGSTTSASSTPAPAHAPKRHPLSLRPALYTKLWSQLHNFDYTPSSLPKLSEAVAKWQDGLEQALRAEEDLGDADDGAGANAENRPTAGDLSGDPVSTTTEAAEAQPEAAPPTRKAQQQQEWQKRYSKLVRRELRIVNPHLLAAVDAHNKVSLAGAGAGSDPSSAGTLAGAAGGKRAAAAPAVNMLAPRKKAKK
ncbi:hypothetical protein JCM8202_003604 [Rhodotorula sphaerocarpa]